jgi:hypothetical protein
MKWKKATLNGGTMLKVKIQSAKACIDFVVGYIDVAGCTTGKFPLVHDLTKINFSGNEFNNTAIA